MSHSTGQSQEPKGARKLPAYAEAKELSATPWDPSGIRVGRDPGIVDINFCRNHLCCNFGKAAGLANGLKTTDGEDAVALYSQQSDQYKCRACGMGGTVHNNRAVVSAFRHALTGMIRYETCPNETCSNHGINYHEAPPINKKKYYSIDTRKTCIIKCHGEKIGKENKLVECGKRFAIGVPWGEQEEKQVGDDVMERRLRMIANGVGASSFIDIEKCDPTKYYDTLENLAHACKEVDKHAKMKLLTTSPAEETINIYSDIMEISLKVNSEEVKSETLDLIVTTTSLNNSFYCLGITPLFFPDPNDSITEMTLMRMEKPKPSLGPAEDAWLDLKMPSQIKKEGTFRPMLGLGGIRIERFYGMIGHFLALRKLLGKFKQIRHYMDSELALSTSAKTAFSDRILDKRYELVAVQQDKKITRKKAYDRRTEAMKKHKLSPFATHSEIVEMRAKIMEKPIERLQKKLLKELKKKFRENAQNPARKKHKNQKWPTIVGNYAAYVLPRTQRKKADKKGEETGGVKDDEKSDLKETEKTKDDEKSNKQETAKIKDPLPPQKEPGRTFLWRTRRIDDLETPEYELGLYKDAEMISLDTLFSALRQVSSAAQRPTSVPSAANRASYFSNMEKHDYAIWELDICAFYWNHHIRQTMIRAKSKERQKDITTRACKFGISSPPGIITMREIMGFREQIFEHTQEYWNGLAP